MRWGRGSWEGRQALSRFDDLCRLCKDPKKLRQESRGDSDVRPSDLLICLHVLALGQQTQKRWLIDGSFA